MGQVSAASQPGQPAGVPPAADASTLLIGSCEAYSGKSALVLGLARQLLQHGVSVRFGKPLAASSASAADGHDDLSDDDLIDDDVRFVGQILGLPDSQLIAAVHRHGPADSEQRLLRGDLTAGAGLEALRQCSTPNEPADSGVIRILASGATQGETWQTYRNDCF